MPDPKDDNEPTVGEASFVASSAAVASAGAAKSVAYPPPEDKPFAATAVATATAQSIRQVSTAAHATYSVSASASALAAAGVMATTVGTPQTFAVLACSAARAAVSSAAMTPPQVRQVVASSTALATATASSPPFYSVAASSKAFAIPSPAARREVKARASVVTTATASVSRDLTSRYAFTAASRATAAGSVVPRQQRSIYFDAASTVVVRPEAHEGRRALYRRTAASLVLATPGASAKVARTIRVDLVATATAAPLPTSVRTIGFTAASRATATARAWDASEKHVFAAATAVATASTRPAGRVIEFTASSGVEVTCGDAGEAPDLVAAASVAVAAASVAVIRTNPTASVAARASVFASAYVVLPGGDTIPGGDANAGLRRAVWPDFSGDHPASFAETPEGSVLIANGVDPMVLWSPLSATARVAGMTPPSGDVGLEDSDMLGRLTGRRIAACRFVDGDGNPSALGPLSRVVDFGCDGQIESVSPQGEALVLTSPDHGFGLQDGCWIEGIAPFAADGFYPVASVDRDRFAIPAATGLGGDQYPGGGSWTRGCAQAVYRNVPAATGPNVARRQVLRNLDGDETTLFVDIDTSDLTSPTLVSSLDDDALSAREAVPLLGEGGFPCSDRLLPPPGDKAVVVNHQGRIFAGVEVPFSAGNVAVTFGSAEVRAVAARFRPGLAGRMLAVDGASRAYEVAAVSPQGDRLTLDRPYADATRAFAPYTIRPAAGARRVVAYSEPGDPQSWAPWSNFAVPEDGDELTSIASLGSFLHVFGSRHAYKFTYQDEPSRGLLYLVAERGVVNHRCWAQTDGPAYLLDERGVWAFGGDGATPASEPIQDLFVAGASSSPWAVDWSRDRRLWHAAHDPARTTIRWFVHRVGSGPLDSAVCLDYRKSRWWVEQYPFPVTSSTQAVLGGSRRSLCGSSARRVFCLSEGSGDVVPDRVVIDGQVRSATPTTIADPAASFPSLAGAPVAIVAGTGVGQESTVADNTATTLTLLRPWRVTPDSTSRYRVGGVSWRWRSGWHQLLEGEESQNTRDVSVLSQPTNESVTADLELFYDHSDVPATWGADVDQNGVRIEAGASRVQFDLRRRPSRSGFGRQRLSGHSEAYGGGVMFVSASLSGTGSAEPVQIYRITIDGARP